MEEQPRVHHIAHHELQIRIVGGLEDDILPSKLQTRRVPYVQLTGLQDQSGSELSSDEEPGCVLLAHWGF